MQTALGHAGRKAANGAGFYLWVPLPAAYALVLKIPWEQSRLGSSPSPGTSRKPLWHKVSRAGACGLPHSPWSPMGGRLCQNCAAAGHKKKRAHRAEASCLMGTTVRSRLASS